jgi:hypothetical protein
MVGRKRVKFGVKIHVRGRDPNPGAVTLRDLDIGMNLRNGNRQRGASVNDRVLAEENDLSGGG